IAANPLARVDQFLPIRGPANPAAPFVPGPGGEDAITPARIELSHRETQGGARSANLAAEARHIPRPVEVVVDRADEIEIVDGVARIASRVERLNYPSSRMGIGETKAQPGNRPFPGGQVVNGNHRPRLVSSPHHLAAATSFGHPIMCFTFDSR